MKNIQIIIIMLTTTFCFSQFKTGFKNEEAISSIALCNTFNFDKQFNSHDAILPEAFTLNYDSGIMSMDNKFRVFDNDKYGVISFRGSTDKMVSWVENCYAAMIPAKGNMTIKEKDYNYTFTQVDSAAVHSGYALTVVMLSKDIIEQVKTLNEKGISNIIITGHSQGGALATLMRAYLEHLPEGTFNQKNNFKTYAFAAPMCGNKEFANDYDQQFSDTQTSFSIINPEDPIPELPINYNEDDKLLNKETIASWVFGETDFDAKNFGKNMLVKLFEGGLKSHIKNSNSLINKFVNFRFGQVDMPEFIDDINYYPTGKIMEIDSFEFPQVEVDVSNMTVGDREKFTEVEGKYYYKEKSFFQHKPYGYYVHVLKKWDTMAYDKLENKFLLTDL
ncbi:lipase family protein [Mangrovimonas spongiae]|uniref:Lipase family protein n=1 Tax=Mangrovimonas spongiae TaxID=2494697 RepID=A0A3R9MGA4_9FLAO|nr:Mbeg1-like protein [Mangrovimonas spongiae]RSK39757.1 lipase family protein [Mangrovimonas spongiae]